MNRTYLSRAEQVILFVMIFLILQEWLKPVMQLTGTGYFGLISLFMALCLIISLFEWPLVVSWLLKIIYISWFINYVYNNLGLSFLSFLEQEILVNFDAIRYGEWGFVTNGFRTFLFFILIWMLVYLIHHWITVRMSIFYFLVMTVFFVATLDTYSVYDGRVAIVKVLLVGFLMTALLFLKRFILKRNILIDWNATAKLMVPVVLVVALVGGTAYLLPKAEPIWPDPVPFLKGISTGEGIGEGFGFGTTQKVGYGSNDERLGGSFVADDTLVFQVVSPSEQYWRVETKDTYTSKGWISSSAEDDEQLFVVGETISHSINVGPSNATETAHVTNLSNHTFLLQPYGVIRYDVAGYTTRMNRINERIRATDMHYTQKVSNYSIEYSEPSYNYTQLTASKVVPNPDFANYLALPNTLPDRVRTLAQEITRTNVSAYDKARAIERYFGRNGFVYDTQNVAIPEKDQDYVDQFLFDTKVGYCDNFSTAMVVMLRAVDIPARWVKGFVTGEKVEDYQDGTALYDITNNEAHSWVEAYIDGIGWMPFEPTIGYGNPADINFDTSEDDEQLLETPDDEPTELEQPENLPEDQTIAEPGTADKKVNLAWVGIVAIVLVVISIIAVLILWFTRKKWLPKYYIRQYRKNAPNEENYVTAYDRLLKQLANYGLKRKKDQTLSSYAIEVDRVFSTDKMTNLTAVYEKLIYAKGIDPSEFDKMKESWEYLINRTSG